MPTNNESQPQPAPASPSQASDATGARGGPIRLLLIAYSWLVLAFMVVTAVLKLFSDPAAISRKTEPLLGLPHYQILTAAALVELGATALMLWWWSRPALRLLPSALLGLTFFIYHALRWLLKIDGDSCGCFGLLGTYLGQFGTTIAFYSSLLMATIGILGIGWLTKTDEPRCAKRSSLTSLGLVLIGSVALLSIGTPRSVAQESYRFSGTIEYIRHFPGDPPHSMVNRFTNWGNIEGNQFLMYSEAINATNLAFAKRYVTGTQGDTLYTLQHWHNDLSEGDSYANVAGHVMNRVFPSMLPPERKSVTLTPLDQDTILALIHSSTKPFYLGASLEHDELNSTYHSERLDPQRVRITARCPLPSSIASETNRSFVRWTYDHEQTSMPDGSILREGRMTSYTPNSEKPSTRSIFRGGEVISRLVLKPAERGFRQDWRPDVLVDHLPVSDYRYSELYMRAAADSSKIVLDRYIVTNRTWDSDVKATVAYKNHVVDSLLLRNRRIQTASRIRTVLISLAAPCVAGVGWLLVRRINKIQRSSNHP